MTVKDTETGEELEAAIEFLDVDDLTDIEESKGFLFDWTEVFENYELLYKLILKNSGEILGLLCLEDLREEFRVHIKLVEVRIDHTGKDKKIDKVAGCMIAFACEESFKKKYGGFVSLLPKTRLIKHYMKKYGFAQYGRLLGIEGLDSRQLLQKYLGYEF